MGNVREFGVLGFAPLIDPGVTCSQSAGDGQLLHPVKHHVLAARRRLVHLTAGGVRVLATSREPLGVSGEQVVEVGPMADAEAAAMFAE